MQKTDYLSQYKKPLAAFSYMSKTAGSRSDYVQGGGGNTSCKLDDRLMAIKASGFRLDQITEEKAYAVLDYQAIRAFYRENNANDFDDVEAAGSAKTKASVVPVDGLEVLRPSVEAGFHAMLDRFVLHSHSIYANLAACSEQGRDTAAKALAGLDESYAFVPYINPGAQLTYAIDQARIEGKALTGKTPAILFMENHGLIITGDDEQYCLDLHQQVNDKLAAAYATSDADWPTVALTEQTINDNKIFLSATDWLREKLLKKDWQLDMFTSQALYPDQLVFLAGQMTVVENVSAADYLAANREMPEKAVIFAETGEVVYSCGRTEAMTMEETLCAVLFIHDHIKKASQTVRTMNEAGKAFIRGWESEKYRKQVAGKDE